MQRSGSSTNGGGNNHAFLWEDGAMTDLAPMPQHSQASDVNDAGQVVGNYNLNRPFLWQDGVLTELGGFAGGSSIGYALGINNAGQIVGYGRLGGSIRAVLLTPTEAGTPTISIGDLTISEGSAGTTTAVFSVALSAPADEQVTVNFATQDGTATAGSDYEAKAGVLTFNPGQATAEIEVEIEGDIVPESNETFQVSLSQATSATIVDGQGVGTILDDEPRISIDNVSMEEGVSSQPLGRRGRCDRRRGGSWHDSERRSIVALVVGVPKLSLYPDVLPRLDAQSRARVRSVPDIQPGDWVAVDKGQYPWTPTTYPFFPL